MRDDASARQIVALNFAAMAQHGIILLLVGPMIPNIMATFGVGESLAGLLLAMGSLGFVSGPLFAGAIIDRVGVRAALAIGFGIELVILGIYGLSPLFAIAVAAHFVLLFGSSFIETSANVMPTLAALRRPAHAVMSLVHTFFSVGAFVGPFLIGLYLQATGEWRPVMFFALVPTGALLAWTLITRFPARAADGRDRRPFANLGAVIGKRYVVFGALTLMLYVGAEVGLSSWVVYYLQRQLGMSAVASASGLSILWIFIMIGRLANSVLGNRMSSLTLVTASGIAGAVGVLLFLLARDAIAAYALLAWIGLCLSGVFPNVMGELNRRDPALTGTVTAVMAMGAAIGAGSSQWLVGFLAEHVSLSVAFATPAGFQLLVVIAYRAAVRAAGRDAVGGPHR